MLTRINRWCRSRQLDGEGGIALVLVIGVGSVLAILVVAAIAFSVGGLKGSRSTQSWNAALAAAYAGVEEYQSRLAGDPSYHRFGNPTAEFSADSEVQLPIGDQANAAFSVGTDSEAWAVVNGSDPAAPARFRYEIDNSQYAIDGTLRLRSTGLVGDVTRSIVADLKQTGFIDFLYFTDYEIQDPAQSGKSVSDCVKYGYDGRPTSGSNPCSNISFGDGDVINGPMHTNDQLRTCATNFKGTVTTPWSPTTGKRFVQKTSSDQNCSAPTFADDKSPSYSPKVAMPPTNTQLKKETRTDLDDSIVQNPGCLYTGPTKIVFNPNGTMTVKSPWTKKTQVVGEPASSGSTPALCGAPGSQSGGLAHADGATFPVPENRVIYVQGKTEVAGDPNKWASGDKPRSDFRCRGADGNSDGNGIGYPIQNEWVDPGENPYNCSYGDLFVEGTVNGNVTIAAENFIFVTNDLKYANSQDDLIGLVGNDAVFVFNPVSKSHGVYNSLLADNRRIDAAILSVAHTFQVQNYGRGGSQGTLEINGAIAQKFRGIVRQTINGTANGYAKSYNYDARLRYTAPPKFLSPVTTTYGVNVWIEVDKVFNADGSYR